MLESPTRLDANEDLDVPVVLADLAAVVELDPAQHEGEELGHRSELLEERAAASSRYSW
jgi:hypothetical protein